MPSIKYSYIYISFKRWFKKNHHRFPNTPQITQLTRNGFSLVFPKVKNIAIGFQKYGGINVWAWKDERFNAEDADLITDFDLYERRDEQGYYFCCCVEPSEHFHDRQKLWEKHSFEFLLDWVLENLTNENYLCIYETDDKGCLWAKIKKQSELELDKDLEFRVFCKPILEQEKTNKH